ncbi:GntR family transcriptional regulator [Alcaligenaceae bacterium]|nr:GntR family transcriptional regulator [Alcaligenaceae bacterium]
MKKINYNEIAHELVEHISSGHYPVGSLLPTELELCAHYDTSRHTIRAALKELQQLGLVSRRRNVGTRVEANQYSSNYQQTLLSIQDLVQFGATHVRLVCEVKETVADIELARELGCPGGTRWLRISSLRITASSEPIGWTDAYIDPAYTEVGELARESPQKLISSLIEARYGRSIAQIHQTVQAITLSAQLANQLKAEPGSPALKIIRRYMDSSRKIFEVTVTIHPADRLTVSMQLSRSSNNALPKI